MHLNKVENKLENKVGKTEREESGQEGGDVTLCCRLHDGELFKWSRNGPEKVNIAYGSFKTSVRNSV